MEFRPCIDIHNGKVKQIVGGSLDDLGNRASENFVAEQDAGFFADFYREKGVYGGHVILLNAKDSEYYAATKQQALLALSRFAGGLQAGGGIDPLNASDFLDAGASHVIVTSYVFCDGRIHYERLEEMKRAVGKERLVLDLSCRKKDGSYVVVTDRWQKFTQEVVTRELMRTLASCCDEFLVHAVDVEGKSSGIEKELIPVLLSQDECPVTYAGGIGSLDDLRCLKELGENRIHATIGSALSLFGGSLLFDEVLKLCG